MQSVPREWLDFLRQQFPKDSRIQLTEIGGNPRPISPGSTGKLDYIDDAGQFHVKWDNGCTLALVLGEDRFSVYLPEPQTFKLYMPLTADFYGRDEWGDMSEDGEEWDGHTLMDYEGQILSALVKNRVPEENESGLMRWYDKSAKTTRLFFSEVQNKLHWAIHRHTAAELIVERANAEKPHMGLTSWEQYPNGKIQKYDVSIAKNYLSREELQALERIVTMYLDYAEYQAGRHIPMTMQDWSQRLNRFLEFNEHEILHDTGRVTHEIAKAFAESEFEKYRIVQDRMFESDFDYFLALEEQAERKND